ncbi:MAG: hypothetical protein U1B78_07450 [Dehalococcoidia bacterium]|nr:hypothetical protein [Dehalococcoidia bacterium]MDZ4278958.1 hypothetical protein [Dehalococcoidia bacterium]
MNWVGLGVLGAGWDLRLREMEHLIRRIFHGTRQEPERELPDVEIADGERLAALHREAARRMLAEGG